LKRKAKQTSRAEGRDSKGGFHLQFSHILLAISGMVLMALIHHLFYPGTGQVWTLHQSAKEPLAKTASQPWGNLEYVPLALDRPDDYFTNALERPLKTRWVLRKTSDQQVANLFSSLNLSEPARSFLLDQTHWQRVADSYQIMPPPEVIISLNPEARGKLYTELAHDPENVPQQIPFTFRPDGFDDWFAECGLPREKIDLVRKLSYLKNENLCFADASVFGELSTPAETMCLLKGLWRVSTFMLKVRVGPETDVDALLSYWGKLGPANVYKPLVESLSRVSEGASINISYFLPPFARLRLYTYPRPDDSTALRADCFWSAMNFFNEKPDDRFFDASFKDQQLVTDYVRVPEKERQFGDLLMLLSPGKEALHMCVYLAADVVFTKNGANAIQPWVLMRIPEMLGVYQRLQPYQIVFYRRKNPPRFAGSSVLAQGF
jgi:hypothetical protein